ncbi:MAG: zinc ribbon domain-containing protein [candidate division Zixibacteria bacterium]|nr:zinc ribbon domain-containing protein [candidate division Zixibacteria bacterium]MCI0595395.1 zinc ribbon domain-containing protein [candidate division Zixibacteria bacterium]
MPTYEYECNSCQYFFEAFQNISEKPLTECPRCGGPVKRKISGGSGLLFKGKGFYITDYRSENYKKKAAEEKPKSESPKEKKDAAKPKSDAAKPAKPSGD